MTSNLDGERADILAGLASARHFLRFAARDLTDEQARQRTTVSELSLGGLIKHVAATEQGWATFIVEGPSALGNFDDMSDADMARWTDGFRLLPDETLAGVLADYEKVAQRTDELVASLPDLDVAHPLPSRPLVPARRDAVGPPGVPAHHRRDRAARRPRRHHPRVPRRRQVHGLTAGERRAGSGLEDHPAGDAAGGLGAVRLDGLGERIHPADLGAQVALVDQAGELGQLSLAWPPG